MVDYPIQAGPAAIVKSSLLGLQAQGFYLARSPGLLASDLFRTAPTVTR